MKTEKEIRADLKATESTYKVTHTRYLKYDNVDDMHALDTLEERIETLKWVLGEK